MFSEENPKRLAQIALVVLLIIGCIAVLLPMIGAVLFAFVIWICTWNTYSKKLLPRLGGRNNLGAALITRVRQRAGGAGRAFARPSGARRARVRRQTTRRRRNPAGVFWFVATG